MARSSTTIKPGQVLNPGGRPKTVAKVRSLARKHTKAAINTLAEIMENPEQHPAARVAAAKELLDRGHGKPMQAHELTGKGGGPIEHAHLSAEKRLDLISRLTAELDREGGPTPVAH